MTMVSNIFEEELLLLQSKNLYRKLREITERQGVRAKLCGQPIVLFCGNDYLGLSQHPRVIAAAKKAADQYGVGSGAARLISGTNDIHIWLEEKIAQFKRKEKALVFTAGYLANVGVLSALAGEKDLIVMDKLCHASLIDGAKLSKATLRVFPHRQYKKCRELLDKAGTYRKSLIVSDAVFSMDGDLADFKELIAIKEKYGCLLVVDDAHGTGVLGAHGRGATEDQDLEDKIDVIIGTLSKALGCLGGFAAADHTTIDYLINHARSFIFATSLPPTICAAALEAIQRIEQEPNIRDRLWENVKAVRRILEKVGLNFPGEPLSPIIPVLIGSEKEALDISERLLIEGVLIPAVRYPTVPKGKARLRLTVSAVHDEDDFKKLETGLLKIFG